MTPIRSFVLAAVAAALALPALAEGPRGFLGRADADGDGALTRAEVAAFRDARFRAADTDGDGAVTRAEMIARAEARAAERAGRMFDRFDADGDGRVPEAEFAAVAGQRLDRLFAGADRNGDGLLTRRELRRHWLARRGE